MGGVISFHCSTIFLLCVFTLFTFFPIKISSSDTISSSESLTGDQTLVSSNDVFELGFFTPGNNTTYYFGIWYKNIPRTYVWVANRDTPLANSSCVFKIGETGNFVITDQESEKVLWSANHTENLNSLNLVAQLLNNGNLVLKEGSDEKNYLWQSFDYPTDTLLPGMKFGWDLDKNFDRFLTSWKSPADPSSGSHSFQLDRHGYPEAYLRTSQRKKYRSGAWNGIRFSGVPEMKSSKEMYFAFESNQDEIYYSFYLNSPTLISRLVVNSTGDLQRFTWVGDSKSWSLFWFAPKDQCDDYEECGPFGICDTNASPVCNCTTGFKPKNPQAWSLRDGSDGCVRENDLDCSSDGFLQLKNMKLPDSSNCSVDAEMSIEECRKACAKNCSCMGYSSRNISDGSGCVMWFGDLVDMRHYTSGFGQDFFVRLSASDIAAYGGLAAENEGESLGTLKIVGIVLGSGIFLLAMALLLVWKKKNVTSLCRQKTENKGLSERSQDFLLNEVVISSKREYSAGETNPDVDLPSISFNAIALATENFSDEKKLGQGGFGIVYKGQLEGQAIAVKRLSKNSGQGKEEFKNEVQLIARLQHRNLVRLLGCCVDMDEKILVYEYMEHRSLDSVLFHKSRSSTLNWHRRFNIILGIARGLLYLHQDSRFRIIHRDLKASNILLDADMTPKISDFGMARIFGTDQVEANTRRVVGTYGYMSPEYAMDGLFSVKSDVFSFGVLVLEIVSGKKNKGFYYSNNELNLLGQAWRLWKEGMGMELLDPTVGNSYSANEVLRCIQVGLLCVQEHTEDRPIMSSVLLMLSSDSATIPHPKNPGFCLGRQIETDSSSSKHDESCTVNNVTVTILDAR